MTGPGDDLGGPLHITPVGSVVVWTDGMLAAVDRLRWLETALQSDLRRVTVADAVATGMPIPGIADIARRIAGARDVCGRGRDALARVAENYSSAEAELQRRQRDVAAFIAATIGAAAFGMLTRLIVLYPHVLAGAALLGWAAIPDTGDGKLATVARFLKDHPELITSPEFVRFVSLVATSIDDATLGALGVPPWLTILPGVDVGGDEGVAAGALTVAALGSLLTMFRETPVQVERVSQIGINQAPEGVRQRLDRIPEDDPVRIEKYEADGLPPRFVVYVGPTETFSPFAGEEPRDLTSNVVGVAGLPAGAFRAVELAMADAGIRPGDEVVMTGFSQGALVATMVAGSGDWNVVGVEAHGGPTGNIPLPAGIAGMSVRHSDDLVPALAGPPLDHHLLQIEREAFRDGVEIPTVQAAPAHQRTAYEATADAIDAAESAQIHAQVSTLDAFTADYLDAPGGTATRMTYQAVRVPSG